MLKIGQQYSFFSQMALLKLYSCPKNNQGTLLHLLDSEKGGNFDKLFTNFLSGSFLVTDARGLKKVKLVETMQYLSRKPFEINSDPTPSLRAYINSAPYGMSC